MANRSIIHLEIPAANRKVTAEFYDKLFGWSFQHSTDLTPYTTFKAGNVGGGYPDLGDMYKPGDILPYVESEDIESDLRQVESLGGKLLAPKMEIPGYGWFAIFADPTGNRMALFTPNMQPAA